MQFHKDLEAGSGRDSALSSGLWSTFFSYHPGSSHIARDHLYTYDQLHVYLSSSDIAWQ